METNVACIILRGIREGERREAGGKGKRQREGQRRGQKGEETEIPQLFAEMTPLAGSKNNPAQMIIHHSRRHKTGHRWEQSAISN